MLVRLFDCWFMLLCGCLLICSFVWSFVRVAYVNCLLVGSFGCYVVWSVDWLVGRLIAWPVGSSVGWLACSIICFVVSWFASLLACLFNFYF